MADRVERILGKLPPGPRRHVEVYVRATRDFVEDELFVWGAAVAFYGVLSLFPLLLVAIAMVALLTDVEWAVTQLRDLLTEVLPLSAEFVDETIRGVYETRGGLGLFSALALLWTGSRVFNALTRAMNIAYDVDDRYTFLQRTAMQLGMTVTLGTVLLLAMLSHLAAGVLTAVADVVPLPSGMLVAVVREGVTLGLLVLASFLIYRFVPSTQQHWKSALMGAVVATLGFRVLRPVFVYYVERFGEYELIYGSVATMILVLLWAWLMSLVLLFGGEVASHFQMIVIEGERGEDVERRHREKSPRRGSREPSRGGRRSDRTSPA